MGRPRKVKAKRSLGRLPKGLPVRNSTTSSASVFNPFDVTKRHHRLKHQVHNRRTVVGNNTNASTNTNNNSSRAQHPTTLSSLSSLLTKTRVDNLARQQRHAAVRAALRASQSANVFDDQRIGQYRTHWSTAEQNLARVVKERSRQSKRHAKYRLDDDDDNDNDNARVVLTHQGQRVDQMTAADHVILSDNDDDDNDDGNLAAADTDWHFGGAALDRRKRSELAQYGPNVTTTKQLLPSLTQLYEHRQTDLDELIARRKLAKAVRQQTKQEQVDVFAGLDEEYLDLAKNLSFRDKEQEIRSHLRAKRAGLLSPEDREMEEWDKEMKQFQFLERKVRASDRTKTPEEVAQETADRLRELETRRLARMRGEFNDDEEDHWSEDATQVNVKKYKMKQRKEAVAHQPEALDDSSDDDDDESQKEYITRFTADGLMKIDKEGNVIGKVGQESVQTEDSKQPIDVWTVGTRVCASYRANEQFDGHEAWYNGVISRVNKDEDGVITYDIDYDDGDFEDNVEPRHVKLFDPEQDVPEDSNDSKRTKVVDPVLQEKRKKAQEKARTEIPYVFEVPTTMDALHDLIATYASTGKEASLIIERIHSTNSVRLDGRNSEKMQNFYDVLLRRFIAVGDAIYTSGDGGVELGRFEQLDALTTTLYAMAQDAPDSATAVWSRRLGFFQNAHLKRLRDSEMEHDKDDNDEDDEFTAWPSTGVFVTLRSLGHIYPVTDLRHPVVTPTLLLLAQIIAHTPLRSMYDLVMGTLCSTLLIEFTKEAKRAVPEALAFFSSVIRLYSVKAAQWEEEVDFALPAFNVVYKEGTFQHLRRTAAKFKGTTLPQLSMEKTNIKVATTPPAVLSVALRMIEFISTNLAGTMLEAERECFSDATNSLLCLDPQNKGCPLPKVLQKQVAATAKALSMACHMDQVVRHPLQRRLGPSIKEKAIKSLAPRLESMSKYKGKDATQLAADRTRRELKREHKAVSRELRIDGALIERERREEKHKKDAAAKAKRQKAFAWLEGEQATLNQQVRQGGGVLQGGGTGAAKAKAATARLGIKKGGKLK